MRVMAVDERTQACLNGTPGVGLWTTSDSNTAFGDLTIRGMTAVGEGAR